MVLPSCVFLMGLLACTGGNDPADLAANGKSFVYTNPAQGDYQLVKNDSLSSSTHLVLDLMGPSGTKGRGVAFELLIDDLKAKWARVASADPEYAQNGSVWDMGSGSLPIVTLVASGHLHVGIGQKGTGVASQDMGGSLARVSLEMVQGASSGDVTFTVSSGSLWPDSGSPQSITVTLGTLKIE